MTRFHPGRRVIYCISTRAQCKNSRRTFTDEGGKARDRLQTGGNPTTAATVVVGGRRDEELVEDEWEEGIS